MSRDSSMAAVYLAAGLEAAFRRIQRERMAGQPFINPGLTVEAVGFRPWDRSCLRVLVTPWSMNLMLLPVEGEQWADRRPGEQGLVRFPSGTHEFILGEEAGIGRYRMCSLFSPVLEFPHQAVAVATARAALEQLLAPPAESRQGRPRPAPGGAPRAAPFRVSRREFLRAALK
ncbi:MAG: [NiFe]-hydrogenase assembly chaperone HybE [Gammaproteobacteria bacterium]|nr:[NiFe]-hydrogenase assembly chaperone HybE [Gammaproteobacteria bacterium]